MERGCLGARPSVGRHDDLAPRLVETIARGGIEPHAVVTVGLRKRPYAAPDTGLVVLRVGLFYKDFAPTELAPIGAHQTISLFQRQWGRGEGDHCSQWPSSPRPSSLGSQGLPIVLMGPFHILQRASVVELNRSQQRKQRIRLRSPFPPFPPVPIFCTRRKSVLLPMRPGAFGHCDAPSPPLVPV